MQAVFVVLTDAFVVGKTGKTGRRGRPAAKKERRAVAPAQQRTDDAGVVGGKRAEWYVLPEGTHVDESTGSLVVDGPERGADGSGSAEAAPAHTPVDPMEYGMAPAYEGEFDNSEELAGTLRAAGRSDAAGDDSDEISFGSETADTDMGHGVRINPNL